MMEFTTDQESSIEVRRQDKVYTLVDVLGFDIDENSTPVNYPLFWEMLIDNAKLCKAEEPSSQHILQAVEKIANIVESHKQSCKDFEAKMKQSNAEIRDILRVFSDNISQVNPVNALTITGHHFKNDEGDGLLRCNICIPVEKPKTPIVNPSDMVNANEQINNNSQ